MSRFIVIAVVAVVLVLAAPPAAAQPTSDPSAKGPCARVVVGPSGGSGGPSLLEGGALSARKFEDLILTVLFLTEIEGDHILELKVYTPRGHLYETLTAPISSDPAERGAVRVPNYPRPLPTQGLQPYTMREGTFAGTGMTFPVAGTAIVTNSLYGRWRVDVLLDHQPITCQGASGSFILIE